MFGRLGRVADVCCCGRHWPAINLCMTSLAHTHCHRHVKSSSTAWRNMESRKSSCSSTVREWIVSSNAIGRIPRSCHQRGPKNRTCTEAVSCSARRSRPTLRSFDISCASAQEVAYGAVGVSRRHTRNLPTANAVAQSPWRTQVLRVAWLFVLGGQTKVQVAIGVNAKGDSRSTCECCVRGQADKDGQGRVCATAGATG